VLILSHEDRAALWHRTTSADADDRPGMLRVLAKEIRDALEAALALRGFDDEIEATVQLLDISGLLARDDLRHDFETAGIESEERSELESAARFALSLSGHLEETAEIDRLDVEQRLDAYRLATRWRDTIAEAITPTGGDRWTVAEVASHFGVTPQAVYKWCRSGKIRFERTPGGSYLVPTAQFDLDGPRDLAPAQREIALRLLARRGEEPPLADEEVAESIGDARKRSSA
jgi:excisionase family DNA binding protein